MEKNKNIPELRFPEFEGEWKNLMLNEKYNLVSGQHLNPDEYSNKELSNFSPYFTGPSDFTNNEEEVAKWCPNSKKTAIKGDIILTVKGSGVGTHMLLKLEKVMMGRQLMALSSSTFSNEFLYHKLFSYRNYYLALASGNMIPGLSRDDILHTKVHFPTLPEQQKIASFLTAVDEKLTALKKKKALLEQYKKGVIQKIFSQEIRFKDENGNEFPKWKERKLKDFLTEHKERSTGIEEVYSVSVHKGLVNQIEHLGRSFAATDTSNYNLVKPNDIVYTKSPTGNFPLGIIKQSRVSKNVIVSPLYGVFSPETSGLGYILHVYFESVINTHNYLAPIIQKGAKNTINITNSTFLSKKLYVPVSKDEQTKIANFLSAIDKKIDQYQQQIEQTTQWKKGLLQKMFV